MDPELLAAVKALVASGSGSKVELAIVAVTVTLTVLGYLERRIRPLVARALDSFLRREREQSVTLRLIAEKHGISPAEIRRAVLEEELRDRAAAAEDEPRTSDRGQLVDWRAWAAVTPPPIGNGATPHAPAAPPPAPTPGGAA